jgi:hypothetical protein
MSLGKQKNLIILGAVAAALLVGGVLVADYADVLPGRTKACEQGKTCPLGEAMPCCAVEAAGFPQVVAATEAAPAEACCGAEKPAGGCDKAAEGCEKPEGCCEGAKPAEAAGGCCAAKAEAATE